MAPKPAGASLKKSASKPSGAASPPAKPSKPAASPSKSSGAKAGASPAKAASGSPSKKKKAPPAAPAETSALSTASLAAALPEPEHAPAPAAEPVIASVIVRYNHYKKPFPITDGVLRWVDVDEEYALSFVFKGNFGKTLLDEAGAPLPQHGDTWSGLAPEAVYVLQITEDAQAEAASGPSKAYVPPSSSGMAGRQLDASDSGDGFFSDKSGCSCLYGNPCVSAYNCADWNNRFDVARRNGWKGHS